MNLKWEKLPVLLFGWWVKRERNLGDSQSSIDLSVKFNKIIFFEWLWKNRRFFVVEGFGKSGTFCLHLEEILSRTYGQWRYDVVIWTLVLDRPLWKQWSVNGWDQVVFNKCACLMVCSGWKLEGEPSWSFWALILSPRHWSSGSWTPSPEGKNTSLVSPASAPPQSSGESSPRTLGRSWANIWASSFQCLCYIKKIQIVSFSFSTWIQAISHLVQ